MDRHEQEALARIQALQTKMMVNLLCGILEELRLIVGEQVTPDGVKTRESVNEFHERLRQAVEPAEAALGQHILSMAQQDEPRPNEGKE